MRIAKADVHKSFEDAGQIIINAGGRNGRTSRVEIAGTVENLSGSQKTLVDVFYKFIDHRDHKKGAQVTATDVTKAVDYAKAKLVDKYDLNQNGLSKSEIAEMSTTAKLAVEVVRERDGIR